MELENGKRRFASLCFLSLQNEQAAGMLPRLFEGQKSQEP